jgi:hypothetical protein
VGWGQYIRSIASVGSTVIVLEWIERVDEEETKRDGKSGVLGRRIFEDEFDSPKKPCSSDESGSRWNLGKKIRISSIFSGLSDKASEWSLKLQSKLDRRASSPTLPLVTELALSNLNSAITSNNGPLLSTASPSEDTRTTTTGDDYTTSYTGTSAASSFSPLVSGKRPKKKHHYPIARSANRTRQLTQTPSLSPQFLVSEVPLVSTSASPNLAPESDDIEQLSSNAPSFHSRESEDRRARFSVLPGFTTGDYFLGPSDLEKRGWTDDRI